MLTGPVPVTEKILRDAGMTIGDIDLFEVNEAFAAVVLRFQQAFDVDPAKVNVNGGSIAVSYTHLDVYKRQHLTGPEEAA